MLIDTLNQKIMEAMKAHDAVRLSTLKLLSSELHNYQIDHPEMSEEEELAIIKKEAKKRKDAIEAFGKFQNPNSKIQEKIKQEREELKILEEYLPEQLSDEELNKIIQESITQLGAKQKSDIGRVIGMVMKKVNGNADGSRVSKLVSKKLI